MRRQIGTTLRDLCRLRGVELRKGHALSDHARRVLSVPPKISVANTVGFLKGKSAVRMHRQLMKQRRVTNLDFWSVGYSVSTIGLDEATIRKYVRDQDERDQRRDNGSLFDLPPQPQRGFPHVPGPSESRAVWAWIITIHAARGCMPERCSSWRGAL